MSNILMSVSSALVRLRARRLPALLALRMEEEWLGELNSITGGPAKLAFAVALLLTRRQVFVAPGEETVVTAYDRPSLGSRKSVVILSTVVFALAAYGSSFLLPVTYEAAATIQSEERSDLMLQQARSRSFFLSVVDDLKPRGEEERERMIADLSNNTTILPVPLLDSGTLLVVKYRADDRTIARDMVRRLANTLISLNMSQRMAQLHEEERYLKHLLDRAGAALEDRTDLPGANARLALEREMLVSSYKALFAKHQDAKMAAAALQSARARIVDLPELGSPVGPNRMAFAGIGGLVGFVLAGIAVVGRGRRQPPAVTAPA
jgi:hypothetical protein